MSGDDDYLKYSALAKFPPQQQGPKVDRPPPSKYPWWISPLAWILVVGIEAYRRLLPDRIKRRCIYSPTCSAFGLAAIKKYGGLRGAVVTAQRIRRCNGALYRGGEDPP